MIRRLFAGLVTAYVALVVIAAIAAGWFQSLLPTAVRHAAGWILLSALLFCVVRLLISVYESVLGWLEDWA